MASDVATVRGQQTTLEHKPPRSRWWREVGWRHVIGVVAIAYCLLPLLYILSASLNPGGSLTGSNQLFKTIDFTNYSDLGSTDFSTWAVNSLIVASVTAVGTVLMCASAAYAFSRFRFTGRRATLTGLLLVQMFPQTLAFVAIFLLLLSIGDVFPVLGLNSRLALIAVYLGAALGTNAFLMYGFFNTIPRELDEAAKIDGATHAQIFVTIILRLVAPILAVVGLLSFIATYGEFVIARVVLQTPENFTLAVGLYNWAADERNAPWGLFAAGAVIASVPIIVLFQFLQRYIVGGLTSGSVKG
ncbi:sugar ABC transporter permease [Actinotalea sp. M2MS4P-6]|uniref:sugar ABC transporter permease n=1 Tax=Actinotalea sp. M2MS4P-6 TaxID=2983762 RepID=UPI0021E49A0F|nr:sugar ABC transporter permease [Actinotalea sp. M2MS4P-6]MCV2392806.1 sugar ABC transporter permease [Actinotalea sp. M2MS4P-6]